MLGINTRRSQHLLIPLIRSPVVLDVSDAVRPLVRGALDAHGASAKSAKSAKSASCLTATLKDRGAYGRYGGEP